MIVQTGHGNSNTDGDINPMAVLSSSGLESKALCHTEFGAYPVGMVDCAISSFRLFAWRLFAAKKRKDEMAQSSHHMSVTALV